MSINHYNPKKEWEMTKDLAIAIRATLTSGGSYQAIEYNASRETIERALQKKLVKKYVVRIRELLNKPELGLKDLQNYTVQLMMHDFQVRLF